MTKGEAAATAAVAAGPKAHKKKASNKAKKLSKTDQKWMDNYEKLKHFKQQNGHTYVSPEAGSFYYPTDLPRVPLDRDYNSFAKWVERQRSAKKGGKLREDREQLLKDIDFYFNPNDYVWDQQYDRIKAIKEQVGHADIPSIGSQVTETNKVYEEYMTWADEQRLQYALYRDGNHNSITERRINKLKDIGFAWSRNEEDAKRIEAKAGKRNLKWILRKVEYCWRGVIDSIKAAKKEHEETGEDTLATYEGQLIAREADGTYFLIFPSELKRYEIKDEQDNSTDRYPIVAFGS